MALLGMGANVQCNGYVPGYYSTTDLIFGTEGSTWTSSNSNIELKNDRYNNDSLPVSSPVHLIEYNKELLKQTILKHEAIFRDQIHELHRIYRIQRELMDEIKRNELDKHNLRLETSRSSSSLSHLSSKIAQRICSSPNLPWSTGQSSVIIAESIQLPLGSGQENSRKIYSSAAPTPTPTPTEGYSKDSKLSESKYRKVGKKILDLHLPADEYIESEEGESSEDERVSKLPRVSAYTLNGISQAVCHSDKISYGANFNGFTDLNKPFKLEEEAAAKSDDLMCPTSYRNSPFHDLSMRTELRCPNLPNDIVWNPYKRKDPEVFSDDPPSEQEKKLERLFSINSAGQSGGILDSFAKLLMGMPGLTGDEFNSFCSGSKKLDAPAFCTKDLNNHSSSTSHELRKYIKGSEDVGTSKNINLNIMPANFSDTTVFQSIKEELVPKGTPYAESITQMEYVLLKPRDSGVTRDFELKMIEASDLSRENIHAFNINGEPDTSLDLYSSHASPSKVCQYQTKNKKIEEIEKGCVSDVNLPCNHVPDLGEQVTTCENLMKNEQEREHKGLAGIIDLNSCMDEDEKMPIDIDLQAPASPENKESSPPRGESNENQLEMPYPLAGQEYSELQEEEVRIAAEALVSISAFVGHTGLQMATCPPAESFVSSPLHWFAGIVSSIMNHPENGVKVVFSGNTDDLEEFLPAGIDYFEAMTLELTETKVLDCCGKSSGQNEEEGGSTSPTQPSKRWSNRGRRRKDFQSEVLPSLTSLSRYEVTEDLQTIGGLMEAAGTRSETGSQRGASRNVLLARGRRSCTSLFNNTDWLLKQLTSNTELGIEKRGFISWGKINRKRRGQRYPARNRKFTLSQVSN